MSLWNAATTKDSVFGTGRSKSTDIWVSASVYEDLSERPKMILEERSTNAGASLTNPEVLNAAIKQVSQKAGIGAKDVDWYVLGKDDELYAVDVEEERVIREDPAWRNLKSSGELSIHELDDAEKAFPEIPAIQVQASMRPIGDEESWNLAEAFADYEPPSKAQAAYQPSAAEYREAELPTNHRPSSDMGIDL